MDQEPRENRSLAIDSDRRGYQRFVVAGIKLMDRHTREILGEVLNLSSGGILVLGPKYIDPAQQMALRMQFPVYVMEEEYLLIDVCTVWCDEVERGLFRTGMKLIPHTGQLDLFAKAVNVFRG